MSPDKSQIIWRYIDDAKTDLKSSLNKRVEDLEKAWFKVLTEVIAFRNKLESDLKDQETEEDEEEES